MSRIKKTFLYLSTNMHMKHFSLFLYGFFIYINLCVRTHRDYYTIGSTKGMKIPQKKTTRSQRKKGKLGLLAL